MSLTEHLKRTTLHTALNYIEKNPQDNALKLLTWADKLAGDGPESFPQATLQPFAAYSKIRTTT